MIKYDKDIHIVPKGEKFICLFSGGKDCGLAIEMALSQGAELYELVHCLNCDTNEAAWHKQSEFLARHQAKCIGAELNIVKSGPYQNRNEFVKVLKKYAEKGIKYVVCGDICFGDQAALEMAVCQAAGLITRMPLWQRDYDEIVNLEQKYKIESIITYIEDPEQIAVDWLGKKFTKEVFEKFKSLGFDPLGEDGEFHTTLINSASFKKELKLQLGERQNTTKGIKIPVIFEGKEK